MPTRENMEADLTYVLYISYDQRQKWAYFQREQQVILRHNTGWSKKQATAKPSTKWYTKTRR